MGNRHIVRQKYCNPIKVQSVAPQKIKTEIGVFYKDKDADLKTVSVGGDSTFALIIIFLGGGYLLLGLIRKFTKRQEPWQTRRRLTTTYYEDAEFSPLVKKVSTKPQTKLCSPVAVNS